MRYEIPGNQRYYGKKVVTEQDTFALSHLLILAKKLKQKEILKLINCQRFSSMDDNRFLDRYDAAQVAFENGQTEKLCIPLFSEDMW